MAFVFRPTLWPTLLTIPALCVLVALGNWQVDRLQWKRALFTEMEMKLSQTPVRLPSRIAEPKAWEFRRVRVTGRFLWDREMRLSPRIRKGRAGFEVITPLAREDGSVVLVNRGWAPAAWPGDAEAPLGPVTLAGVLRTDKPKGGFTPENVPEEGLWFHVDLPEMGRWVGQAPVVPLLLEVEPGKTPGRYPIGKTPKAELSNDHLHYAITWYALAVVLLGIYFLYHLRRRA